MFTNKVVEYLNRNGGADSVPNLNRSKRYSVCLNGAQVELLDRPGLLPIPLSAFDVVEDCLSRGIHTPGCARNRLGDPKLDRRTIMYHIGKDVFGKNDGDAIFDNSCYIFAILEAAGCITRRRGNVEARI